VDHRHLAPGVAAFVAACLVALLGIQAVAGPDDPPVRSGTVRIQLLGMSDLHGHLQSAHGLGGAAWLAAHLDQAAADRPGHTIRVHAGDMVGASPLISSYFDHRSTIDAINLMHFDVGTLGNHEFDQGGHELATLLRRVRIPYVSANVIDTEGSLRLPPYRIVERAGVRVGFIGVTTDTAPRYLLSRYAHRFRFLDISAAVNRWVPALRRRGVNAIVVLAHSGSFQSGEHGAAAGEIVDEARQMSDAVDVIVAGHSHSYLNTRVDGKLIVESYAYGSAYDRVQLRIDRASGEVVSSSAQIPRTRHTLNITPDPKVAAVVRRYVHRVAPVANRVLATARHGYSRERGDLGRLVADAQRNLAHADFAFVNPGNMRGDVSAGPVTYAEVCTVEAYAHRVMRMTLRGADVTALLEQQWAGPGTTRLYASGLRYRREGHHLTKVSLADGRPLDPDRRYTVAANELIATGSRFSVLRRRGRGKEAVGTDVEALVSYLERHPRGFG
jgi:5'-nucleotidase